MYELILLFVQLVDIGSYSKLADKLKITRSTLTRNIQRLEENLGQQLFIRNSSNLKMTDFGNSLYQNFCETPRLLESMLNRTLQAHQTTTGLVKLAATPGAMRAIFNNTLPILQKKYPEITLEFQTIGSQDNYDLIDFDIAVNFTLPKSNNLLVKSLGKNQINYYCSQKFIQKYGAIKSPDELFNKYSHFICERFIDNKQQTKQISVINNLTGISNNYQYIPKIRIPDGILPNGVNLDNIIVNSTDGNFYQELANKQLIKLFPDYSFGDVSLYLIRHQSPMNHIVKIVYHELEQLSSQIQQILSTIELEG